MHPTRYGTYLLLIAILFLLPVILPSAILNLPTGWIIFIYPTLSFSIVGILLIARKEHLAAILLGKSRFDGSFFPYCMATIFLPYLLFTWLIWIIRVNTTRRNEHGYDEVSQGIYLGRYPWYHNSHPTEFPQQATIVVDLTAEMPFPRKLFKNRRCFFLPTLDHCAPGIEEMIEIANLLAPVDTTNGNNITEQLDPIPTSTNPAESSLQTTNTTQSNHLLQRLSTRDDHDSEGTPLQGCIMIFCANGKGRSATFCSLLIAMRHHCTIREAFDLMKKSRPQVSAGEHQIIVAEEALESWISTGGRNALEQRMLAHEHAREKSKDYDQSNITSSATTTTTTTTITSPPPPLVTTAATTTLTTT
jgi:protein-tyrosine phosphatase